MPDSQIKVDGIQPLNDDELDAAAGGFSGGSTCGNGHITEAQFPQARCKNCPEFKGEKFARNEAVMPYRLQCKFYNKTSWKNTDEHNLC